MSTMPKWLLVLIIGSVSVCLCCGGAAVFAGYKIRHSGPNVVAKVVAPIVGDSLADNRVTNGVFLINESDLDINNSAAPAGDANITTGSGTAQIAGLSTTISPDGIVVASPDGSSIRYAAMPVVLDGQIDMQIESGGDPLFGFFNFKQGIFDGIERAINDTLAARGLQATSITLHDGSIVIETTPV